MNLRFTDTEKSFHAALTGNDKFNVERELKSQISMHRKGQCMEAFILSKRLLLCALNLWVHSGSRHDTVIFVCAMLFCTICSICIIAAGCFLDGCYLLTTLIAIVVCCFAIGLFSGRMSSCALAPLAAGPFLIDHLQ